MEARRPREGPRSARRAQTATPLLSRGGRVVQDSAWQHSKRVLTNCLSIDWRLSGLSCKTTNFSLEGGAPQSLSVNGKSAYSGGRRGKPEQAVAGNLHFLSPLCPGERCGASRILGSCPFGGDTCCHGPQLWADPVEWSAPHPHPRLSQACSSPQREGEAEGA